MTSPCPFARLHNFFFLNLYRGHGCSGHLPLPICATTQHPTQMWDAGQIMQLPRASMFSQRGGLHVAPKWNAWVWSEEGPYSELTAVIS